MGRTSLYVPWPVLNLFQEGKRDTLFKEYDVNYSTNNQGSQVISIPEMMVQLANAGISFVPVGSDKHPAYSLLPIAVDEHGKFIVNESGNYAHEWTRFQSEIPSAEWIRKWRNAWGIAIIGGKVSGNLFCLDFEAKDHKHEPMESVYQEWKKLVKAERKSDAPHLFPVSKTMSGGIHVRWRVKGDYNLVNEKLAFAWSGDSKNSKPIANCLIEAKAEGGYALCPPSPGYEMVQGNLTQIPTISIDKHERLVAIAKSFHSAITPTTESMHTPPRQRSERIEGELMPGEDYNLRGDHHIPLNGAGWTLAHISGETEYWKHPTTDNRWSATFNAVKCPNLFWTWSPNTPFEPEKGYNRFAMFAILMHDGDFSAAARDLHQQGFGSRHSSPPRRTQIAPPDVETKETEKDPPAKKPKGLAFPESAWRGVFEVYRRAVEGINEAPIAYSFAALKTIAGIVMGRTAYLYVGRRLYPNFFSCLVGPTGISRKSTAADLSIEEILANADPNVIYLAGLATSEGLISKLEVPSATADAEENDAPKLSLFMQARVDATSAYEGFRVMVSLAEYAALLKKAKKSSSDGLIQTLTAAYDCPIVLENPTRHAPQKAVKPCTSIIALSTQEWMEESLDIADIRGGFANRFCYYLYEQTKPNPHPTEPNTKDIGMVIQHLHQTRTFFQGKHIKFEFDSETYKFVDNWYSDIWYQAVNEPQELVRDAIQRLDSNARKLALLYAMLENSEDDRQIHIEQFKAAVDVAIYWKETALSIFSTFAPNIQAKNERRIMDKLAEKPRTRRQLQQAIGGGSMSAKDFNDALDALYKAQRVETVDGIYMLT